MAKKKTTILMVDDEPDFIKPMSFWFGSKGYNVVTASSGMEALGKIQKKMPDIIFLDLRVPGMDGLATLDNIRKISKEVPVIIISAYVEQVTMKDLEPHNISGVFYKGKNFEEGLVLVESVLRAHKKLKA